MNAIITAIDAARVAPPPEPFEVESPPTPWPADALPDGMAEAADAIAEHVQAPHALAAFAVLGAVAHIAQRLTDARHPKTGAMPCSLYLLSSADSGDRKSTCYGLATWPVTVRERKLREEHKAECQRIEAAARQTKGKENKAALLAERTQDPRTIFTDATVQKIAQTFCDGSAPALSLSTDEGGALFSGHSLKSETRAASMGALTRLFDGRGAERDRIGGDGVGPSGFRHGVRFGLFLSAQPVVLSGALSDPLLRGQGLLPRFLYCAPASLAGERLQDYDSLQRRASDDPRIVAYWQTLRAMDEAPYRQDEHGGLILAPVGMDAEAVAEWLGLYNDTEAAQGDGGAFCGLRAFAGRAGELAARTAAVFAIWRAYRDKSGYAPTVTRDDMRRAAMVVRYSLAEWKRHADAADADEATRTARDLLDWLHRKNWREFTRTKLATGGPAGLRADMQRRSTALDELTRRRWLIETAGTYTIVQKHPAQRANANPANFANSRPPDPAPISGISGFSVSSPRKEKTQTLESGQTEAREVFEL